MRKTQMWMSPRPTLKKARRRLSQIFWTRLASMRRKRWCRVRWRMVGVPLGPRRRMSRSLRRRARQILAPASTSWSRTPTYTASLSRNPPQTTLTPLNSWKRQWSARCIRLPGEWRRWWSRIPKRSRMLRSYRLKTLFKQEIWEHRWQAVLSFLVVPINKIKITKRLLGPLSEASRADRVDPGTSLK